MPTLEVTRLLELGESPNFRHIGGYPTKDGGRTSDRIVRASSLHRLTPEGLGTLATYGIRTVVDLRSEQERKEFATPDLSDHGMRHVVAPVFETDASPAALAPEFPGFSVIYQTFLETGREAYRALVEALATSDGGFLYHCAVGKDRTGVATALLLDLVGVPDELIIEDYAHSGGLLAPMLPQWVEGITKRGLDASRAELLMASPPEDMVATLAHLRDSFGDAEGYFLEIGLAESILDAARVRLAG